MKTRRSKAVKFGISFIFFSITIQGFAIELESLAKSENCRAYLSSMDYSKIPDQCVYYIGGYLEGILQNSRRNLTDESSTLSDFQQRAQRTRLGKGTSQLNYDVPQFCVPTSVDKIDLYWMIQRKLNEEKLHFHSFNQLVFNTLKEEYPC